MYQKNICLISPRGHIPNDSTWNTLSPSTTTIIEASPPWEDCSADLKKRTADEMMITTTTDLSSLYEVDLHISTEDFDFLDILIMEASLPYGNSCEEKLAMIEESVNSSSESFETPVLSMKRSRIPRSLGASDVAKLRRKDRCRRLAQAARDREILEMEVLQKEHDILQKKNMFLSKIDKNMPHLSMIFPKEMLVGISNDLALPFQKE